MKSSFSELDVVPQDIERDAGRLLDVAMWCLGQDVRYPGGNLLVRFGCLREPLPLGREGTSAYSAPLHGARTLTLWGFGALVRQTQSPSGVFFRRDLLRPKLVALDRVAWPVFERAALGELRTPEGDAEILLARSAAAALTGWLGAYEAWVARELGCSYRGELLSRRRKRPPCAAEALPGAWQRFATRLLAVEAP